MSLLTLPPELCYRIFDYCDAQTTLFSIRCVCKQLNGIVDTYNRIHLILDSKFSNSIAGLSHFLQPENVVSLLLGNGYGRANPIKLFISLFAVDRFTRLRSLTLYNINNDDLKHLVERMNMNQMISLSVHSYDNRSDNRTWAIISALCHQCNLQKLSVPHINYQLECVTWPEKYQLSCLSIGDCTFDSYLAILHQLPNLQTLAIQQCHFEHQNNTLLLSSPPLLHSSLTSLTISNYTVSLQNLAPLLSPIPSLQHLKLISHTKTFDYVFDGTIWQNFILTNMLELKQFEFFFSYAYSNNHNIVSHSLNSIMQPFRTPFYLDDKRWFVTCDYVPRFRSISVYTTPICTISHDYKSPLRCELSSKENICRLTQAPLNETRDTVADETSFSILDLGGYWIGDQGIQYLSDGLRHNTKIISLDLHDNSVQDQGIRYLADALQHVKTLTTLDLHRNTIGDRGAKYLARVLCHNETLTSLNLLRNRISDQGIRHLAHALRSNQTLTTLHLWNNEIGDQGAQSLSIALRHNLTLKLLDLGGNKIGNSGATQLADALQYNKTLKQLWLWNNNISLELKQQLQEQDRRIEC